MSRCAVSVIMGVLYRNKDTSLLRRSIDSLLTQTFADFELLICDDGSCENAVRLLDSLAEADHRIRLLRPGDRFSLPSKLNYCLSEAKGELIARMDDDDYSYPDRLQKQVDYLQAHKEIAFVGCNVRLVYEGQEKGKREFPQRPQVRDFYMTQPYIHPTLVFRIDALKAVGGYSEDPHQNLCEDYDLLLRLYEKGFSGANFPEILFDYTVRADAKDNRKLSHRWNEVVTRYQRFRALGVLPKSLPYVIKPVIVGLLPSGLVSRLKNKR